MTIHATTRSVSGRRAGAGRDEVHGESQRLQPANLEIVPAGPLDVGPAATVRWNNYHKELGAYHGEVVGKGDVMRAFLAQSEVNGDHDFSRIAAVVDMIVSECTAMRESARLAALEAS